jgi:hypothetical protein
MSLHPIAFSGEANGQKKILRGDIPDFLLWHDATQIDEIIDDRR